MKNRFLQTFTVSVLLMALIAVAGCKKYTKVEAASLYSISQAFADVSNATIAVIGVYDELMGYETYGQFVSTEFPYDSDEGYQEGDIDNGRRGIGRYQFTISNSDMRDAFRSLYRGVERANLCIEQIPLMPQYTKGSEVEKTDLQRLYGEALTLRAQFLFELIRNWGDVPAPLIPAYKQTSLFIGQTDRDSTYDRIIADLAVAKDLLPWRTLVPKNERITKGTAKALRARIALFRGGYSLRSNAQMERRPDFLKYYQIAKDECAELIANRAQHTLNPSFENIWRDLTSFKVDSYGERVFEVGEGGATESLLGFVNGPILSNASRYGAAFGGTRMMPSYFYAFDSVDTRRDVTITFYRVASSTNIKSVRRLGEITSGKFRRDWRVPLLPGTQQSPGFNWVLIRFSDVLLMYAEAANEINNGPDPLAITSLEEVRKRAFKNNPIGTTPTDKAGFFNAIVNERFLEFGEEGIRKYDLIRWNLLATKIAETRIKLQQIRDRVAPYDYVPEYVYFKNAGEEITWYTGSANLNTQPFWRPQQTPSPITGWSEVSWSAHLKSNVIDGKPLYQAFAGFFVTGKSELMPYDQGTLDSYQGALKQNPGY